MSFFLAELDLALREDPSVNKLLRKFRGALACRILEMLGGQQGSVSHKT